jgi:UDP-glucose 4-epimerase
MHYIITGGTGYIGSHMAALLHSHGHRVTVLDNFSNSSHSSLSRLQKLCDNKIRFMEVDLRDETILESAFLTASIQQRVDGVLHFAGLKAVGESSVQPIEYYQNNVSGTVNLTKVMAKHRIYSLVFSSSATVYGVPESLPLKETHPTSATNVYGRTKLMCENFLHDLSLSHPEWRIAALRYFNPVGAHPSGEIGEEPNGTPNNLMPYVFDVACGKRNELNVFGGDYKTHDGTGVRDYIHVVDLVEGHACALEYLEKNKGFETFNLGTGQGYSVLDMVFETEKLTRTRVPYRISSRRLGDVGTVYASVKKAKAILNWEASRSLPVMIKDQWRWVKNK